MEEPILGRFATTSQICRLATLRPRTYPHPLSSAAPNPELVCLSPRRRLTESASQRAPWRYDQVPEVLADLQCIKSGIWMWKECFLPGATILCWVGAQNVNSVQNDNILETSTCGRCNWTGNVGKYFRNDSTNRRRTMCLQDAHEKFLLLNSLPGMAHIFVLMAEKKKLDLVKMTFMRQFFVVGRWLGFIRWY